MFATSSHCFLQNLISIILVIVNLTPTNSLPVTSKPIENTPEHLAWEAWVMLPPSSNERTRKITPKSIFILPNTSQDGPNSLPKPEQQMQCPPGYRNDNAKCIPVISVNHQELVIQQLASLFPNQDQQNGNDHQGGTSTAYEDYDYDTYDTPMTFSDSEGFGGAPVLNPNPSVGGGTSGEQPLKINFSLDKLPDKLSPSNLNLDSLEKSEEIKNGQVFRFPTTKKPFRFPMDKVEDDMVAAPSTSTFIAAPSTAKQTAEIFSTNATTNILTNTTPSKIDENKRFTTSSSSTTNIDDNASTKNSENETIKSINRNDSTLPFLIHMDQDYSSEYIASPSKIAAAPTAIPLLSSAETEFNHDDLIKNNRDDYRDDYDLVTETSHTEQTIKDNLAEESLIFDRLLESGTTLSLEDSTETLVEASTDEMDSDILTTTNKPVIEEELLEKPKNKEHSIQNLNSTFLNNSKILLNESSIAVSTGGSNNHQQQLFVENEPLKKNIEEVKDIDFLDVEVKPTMGFNKEAFDSSNRFIYHHFDSYSSPPESVSSATHATTSDRVIQSQSTQHPFSHDINEQLRMINMIVEENKRKQESGKIRFPDEIIDQQQREGLRADSYSFPEVTASSLVSSSPSHFSFQTNQFDPNKFLFHRRYFQPLSTTTPTTTTTTTTTTDSTTDKTKPFWWLPPGWEVDHNGDRPLLIRFWARSPTITAAKRATVINNPTATTSGYRENSRYPTDNLYREISAQEVYKVLGAARQWKHSSKR